MRNLIAGLVCAGVLGFVGVQSNPTAYDVDARAVSNGAYAGNFHPGSHWVYIGTYEQITTVVEGEDPCMTASGGTYITGALLDGDGSVVSILDKYHSCEWNPWT